MNTAIKINPLLGLIGTWQGDKGLDLAPKPVEDERNPYYETLIIEPVDIAIENAETQELTAVKYFQVVREKSNDKVSHNEVGYWIWDNNTDTIMCSLSIPRGLSLVAGGEFTANEAGDVSIEVNAKDGDAEWGIVQSPFLKEKARTLSFKRTFKVEGNKLTYKQEMELAIYNKSFNHVDSNVLTKVD
ncbi:FABP family protein (plasmid) [Persicobacter psychrovividus]|uniref:FABP family protein n=2 Tax=Persicobacter psychrovividus TaxID=387638 RepID=A0ABM7VMK6_9BACT|nr:FABP family protein [Persicobacter psychrovividus]